MIQTATKKELVVQMKAEGKTYGEIAEELGITKNYAKQIIHRARASGDYAIPAPPQPEPKPKPPKKPRPEPKQPKSYGQLTAYDIGRMVQIPGTKDAIALNSQFRNATEKIGSEKITAFVNYHIEMAQMRVGVNKRDVQDLYARFFTYLKYCADHGILPNNMNCYYAIGIDKRDISAWYGGASDSEHKRFAEDVKGFFASIHEQAPTEGLMNPISAMFWQKAHDGMIEAQKLETVQNDPFGERQSAEEISAKYAGIELPD